MANPLLSKQKATSTDPTDRQVTPIAERYEGQNWPYRGMENHGVEPTNKPDDMPGYDGTIPVELVMMDPPPDPIPVKIVGEGGRQLTDWTVSTFTVFANAVRVLDADRNGRRKTALVKNLGPNTAYVGPSSESASGFMAWKLGVGESLSTNVDTDVYAVAAAATSPTNVYAETPGFQNVNGNTANFDLSAIGDDIAALSAIVNVSSSAASGNKGDYVFQTSEDGFNWIDASVVTVTDAGLIRSVLTYPNRYFRVRWRNFTGAPAGQTISNIWMRAIESQASSAGLTLPQQATLAVYQEYDIEA